MSPGTRLLLALLAVLAVFGLVGLTVVVTRDDAAPLDRARDTAANDANFDTGVEAGETLARVAQHLNDAITECRASAGSGDATRCLALGAASGWVQVTAAAVLTCTAPGRYEARSRTSAYLDAIAALAPTDPEPPPPPPLVVC